jgi:aminoglycoside phosphotransferase (APT) family kinase protein
MAEPGVRDVPSAVAAARSVASGLGLSADEAIVLHASNRLALRLLPSDVLARVASAAHQAAQLEVDLAGRLAGTDTPVAALDPRVAPRVYERDGFAITLWTYYASESSRELSPAVYADALKRLHVRMQDVDLSTPHFTDRVKEAEAIVVSRDRTPELSDADRNLLRNTFTRVTSAIRERGAPEQLLHGEPHPGNVLNTENGPLFVDLETCCRGPVEFDLAHVPDEVSQRYPNVDHSLLSQCRVLALAMVAAWRLDPGDRFPRGSQAARELLTALRAGPPYPLLGAITGLE